MQVIDAGVRTRKIGSQPIQGGVVWVSDIHV